MRALNALGNGTSASSRPSTPTPLNFSMSGSTARSGDIVMNAHGFLSQKLNKIMSDRQSVRQFQKPLANNEEDAKLSEMDISQNGKNDSWQEDQEV